MSETVGCARRALAIALSMLVLAAIAVLPGITGCGAASRPGPPLVRQPSAAFLPVPYPPPPGRVEFVPAPPQPGAIWISGEWDFRFRRWAWTHGRWILPPARATYARWALRRDDRGELWFAPGAWRDTQGTIVDEPEPLATGNARDRSVLEEDGTAQTVAPNRAPPPPLPPR